MSTDVDSSAQSIFRRHELWRLLTSATIFSSTPEILFGLYLVYFFRIFERQVGSNKYTVREGTLGPCPVAETYRILRATSFPSPQQHCSNDT